MAMIKIDTAGKGWLDKELAGEAAGIVADAIHRVRYNYEVPTISELARCLGIHPKRCSRLVHALGLRDEFPVQGRPRKELRSGAKETARSAKENTQLSGNRSRCPVQRRALDD